MNLTWVMPLAAGEISTCLKFEASLYPVPHIGAPLLALCSTTDRPALPGDAFLPDGKERESHKGPSFPAVASGHCTLCGKSMSTSPLTT